MVTIVGRLASLFDSFVSRVRHRMAVALLRRRRNTVVFAMPDRSTMKLAVGRHEHIRPIESSSSLDVGRTRLALNATNSPSLGTGFQLTL